MVSSRYRSTAIASQSRLPSALHVNGSRDKSHGLSSVLAMPILKAARVISHGRVTCAGGPPGISQRIQAGGAGRLHRFACLYSVFRLVAGIPRRAVPRASSPAAAWHCGQNGRIRSTSTRSLRHSLTRCAAQVRRQSLKHADRTNNWQCLGGVATDHALAFKADQRVPRIASWRRQARARIGVRCANVSGLGVATYFSKSKCGQSVAPPASEIICPYSGYLESPLKDAIPLYFSYPPKRPHRDSRPSYPLTWYLYTLLDMGVNGSA
jgi:hypothetical protein